MRENIRQAIQGVWSHKLRSVLTMLGIIIGIAAIIAIVSTIKGTNEQIKQNLIGAGNNTVTVSLYQDDSEVDMSWSEIPDSIGIISPATKAELNKLKGVEQTALYLHRGYTDGIFYQSTAFNGDIYGIDSDYFSVYDYPMTSGRTFLPDDYQTYRKVAIVDGKVVNTLFQGEDPIGKTIEIMAEPFTVVGVVNTESGFRPVIENINDYYLYADTSSGHIYVPDSTWPIIYRYDEPQSVAVKAKSTDDMAAAGKAVADALTKSQIGEEDSHFSYQNRDLLEQAQQLQEMSNATNRQLIWIASISLLVGGIGVMNIMLVSVTERTPEIGLKKALGARKRKISAQFLTEAGVLTCIGGILGVLVGIGLAYMVSRVSGVPIFISWYIVAATVIFSFVVGLFFGAVPAVQAARLNPIDALRRE